MKIKTVAFIVVAALFAGFVPEYVKALLGPAMECIGAIPGTPCALPAPVTVLTGWLYWPWPVLAWIGGGGLVALGLAYWWLSHMKSGWFDVVVKSIGVQDRTCLVTGLSELDILSDESLTNRRLEPRAAATSCRLPKPLSDHWAVLLRCMTQYAAHAKGGAEGVLKTKKPKDQPLHFSTVSMALASSAGPQCRLAKDLLAAFMKNRPDTYRSPTPDVILGWTDQNFEDNFAKCVDTFIKKRTMTPDDFGDTAPPDFAAIRSGTFEILPEDSGDGAILRLSAKTSENLAPALKRSGNSPGRSSRIQLLNDIRRAINATDKDDAQYGPGMEPALEAYVGAVALESLKWSQTLRAIAHMPMLKKVVLVPSAESLESGGSAKQVAQFAALVAAVFPDRILEIVDSRANRITPDEEAAPPQGIDYESIENIEESIKHILSFLKKEGYKDSDIAIDVTAGQKSFSVAAAIHTLQHAYAITYVNNHGVIAARDCKIALLSDS